MSVETIYGTFGASSKARLDLTFDYEHATIQQFRKVCELLGVTTVLDIGANVGVYSILTAEVPTVRKVYAFEPAPEAYRLLEENVALQNASSKFSALNLAVSNEVGEVSFNVITPTSGANKIATKAESGDLITVPVCTIDSRLAVSGDTIAIKIDVEGHELLALKGMRSLLANNTCYVQVEALRPSRKREVHAFISELGYLKAFQLRDDVLYLSPKATARLDEVREAIYEALSQDLEDLKRLRLDKRHNATAAKKLWSQLGYARDPLLKPAP